MVFDDKRDSCARRPLSLLAPVLLLTLAASIPGLTEANPRGVTTKEGPWLHEDDFDADDTLHARAGQTVVFELEQGSGRGRGANGPPGQNTSRLLVEKTGTYEFCLPEDEPHIVRLKLREGKLDQVDRGRGQARGRTVLQARPGDGCVSATLAPGSYVVDAFHDHRNVPEGKVAFLRFPNESKLEGDPLTASTAVWSLLAWRAPDGKFVRAPSGQGNLVATATSVDEYAVYKMSQVSNGWKMADGAGHALQNQAQPAPTPPDCSGPLFTGTPRGSPTSCPSKAITFTFFSKSSAPQLFNLGGQNTAWSEDGVWGYEGTFYFNTSTQTVDSTQDIDGQSTRFTTDFQGFTCADLLCDSTNLKLQQGQVALFTEEGFKGTAFVFRADVPNLGIYNAAASKGLAVGNDQARSVRVGPNTLALLYANTSFSGTPLATAADIGSLDDASLPIVIGNDALSSFRIEQTNSYILASNGCRNCDLTGISLGGKDLSGTDFTNATLSGADLTDTTLFMATLDKAVIDGATLTGTDLLETSLRCTTLSDNDLTHAKFTLQNGAIAAVVDSPSILAVDPASGRREGISAGGGLSWSAARGVGRASEGVWAAVNLDQIDGAVARVIDTNRNAVSYCLTSGPIDTGVGDGPCLVTPADVVEAADGSLIVVDLTARAVVRVDPDSGDRSILSDGDNGNGPNFLGLNSVDIGDDGTIYVIDLVRMAVMAVDPMTGDRTIVSNSSTGTGPAFQLPAYVSVAPDGSLLVTDSAAAVLLRVDPATGDRSVISDATTGTGTAFVTPAGVAAAFDGSILVADTGLLAVLDVDPDTGDRTVVSDGSTGTGVAFQQITDLTRTDTATLASRIVTDFSCRVSLARSTLNIDSVPPPTWRYLDLSGATIAGTAGATLSTLDDPVDFSGAVLNALDLSGSVLDGANFSCAPVTNGATTPCVTDDEEGGASGSVCTCLSGTRLQSASLKQTNFTNAILWGALLGRSNLDGAVMSGAELRAQSDGFTGAADISGAFMRNVQLDSADLTSVTADNVNFYSTAPDTASASGATMTNMSFDDAYLAGADFGDATLQSTSWERAVLTGANFENAQLQVNPLGGQRTNFNGAFMHGTVFDNANVSGAFFTDTYWDLDTFDPKVLNVQMQIANLEFAGYWQDPSSTECVSGPYPNDAFSTPAPPSTDASNLCPDGSNPGSLGCTFMETPSTPIENATPTTSVCTQDDVDAGTCVLPQNPDPSRQCLLIDICWVTGLDCSPAP